MMIEQLQRKLERYSKLNPALFERMKLGTGVSDIERWRERIGGVFGYRKGHRWFKHNSRSGRVQIKNGAWRRGTWMWEPTTDWAYDNNLVVNEGLAYVIDVAFREVADIAPWYIIIFTANTTPVATHTYAAPGGAEATGANLDETVRQAWVDGAATGTTTRSVSGTAVTYTGDNSFTAYGARMLGGGTLATTLADTAGGGSLYCSSLFGASQAMTLDDTLSVTYTVNATDDGV